MSALVEGIQPRRYGLGAPTKYSLDIAANTVIPCGSLVCKDATGNCVNGTATAALVTVGVATATVDNTGGAAAAKQVPVEGGVFGFQNSTSTDAITKADLFNDCYVVDNQTVAKTSNTNARPVAGKIVHLEDGLVYVHVNGGK